MTKCCDQNKLDTAVEEKVTVENIADVAVAKPEISSGCCGSVTTEPVVNQEDASGGCCSAPAIGLTSVGGQTKVDGGVQTSMRIMQMDCPTEESMIRKKLGAMDCVSSMEFNLMQRVLTVVHTEGSLDDVLAAVRSLDFDPELPDASGELGAVEQEQKPWWPLIIAALIAVASEAVGWIESALIPDWTAAALALVAIVMCGGTTYKKGWVALKNGNMNINALMSIAVTGAAILGEWPEAAMVMVLFTIAELIEAKSLDRARNAIAGLMELTPERVTVRQTDGSWQDVDAKTVAIDDVVRVKPGERIGLDGELVAGASSINQAPITGESLPVDKTVGDAVFAGTINESGSFEYKVTAAAGQTTLARIIHAVEEAQGTKAPTQRFVDKFAKIYTPIVFIVAFAVAVLPPLFLGGGWQDWIYKALVLLVIACPCALVISTPVTIVSGLAAAARQGILIKGGVYLEQGRLLKWLALDKTGTITHGKPVLTDFQSWDTKLSEEQVKTLAASLAGRSDHPVSVAIVKAETMPQQHLEIVNFAAVLGRGVQGEIDGEQYHLGNQRLIDELQLNNTELQMRLNELEQQGKTVVMLADQSRILGLFAVADTVKESSQQAIAELHALGVKTAMLTGDNPHTARAIAAQVGIDEARGNQLPEDKLTAVKNFATDGAVGMVGDGINDAPALAQSEIGFAMGAMGTDTAIETADVALMDDDLRKIPAFVRLSQGTRNILAQNIALALGIKGIFLVLTMIGLGTMWMAVFADVGASLLVVANGLRLLKKT
ncbi:heavy metal translocating P-type ATPase [Aliamphritea ceti]|uniref:heavy metal translocating P-type ATPase n=1 Tax=Aliamphritea ceti TaxID=1524258 RepID=UPI0021C362E4|nr:heavy metal translocating P-type ATPase [Aliamphritea ceti]